MTDLDKIILQFLSGNISAITFCRTKWLLIGKHLKEKSGDPSERAWAKSVLDKMFIKLGRGQRSIDGLEIANERNSPEASINRETTRIIHKENNPNSEINAWTNEARKKAIQDVLERRRIEDELRKKLLEGR